MNATEVYNAIKSGNRADQQGALLELLEQVKTLAIGVLELAGDRQLASGRDPLMGRTRLTLSDFLELEK